jgi:3-(3-hydroxy-phenyl)propionate hydroxylase
MTSTFAIIVGAGPVGLMLANLLGRSGAEVLVLERRREPFTVPRAIAYDAETLRLFQKIGLLDALEPTLEQDVPVSYLNGRGRVLMRMSRPDQPFGHSQLGSFYQPELEAVLRGGIERYPNVVLKMGARVTGLRNGPDAAAVAYEDETGETRLAEASFVVGCDGGMSFVRDAAGIPFGGTTFTEKWLVVDCEDEGYGLREMRFFCDPRRPALTIPVSRGRRRWEFLVLPGESAAELEREDVVRRLIRGYAPNDTSRIERSLVYTFHARYADQFRKGRVLLAGDAAHINPPFAGQGLNGGLRDVHNLAWKLDLVRRGVAGEALLDTYETERRPHVKAMTDFAIRLGRDIMPTSRLRASVRDILFTFMSAMPGYTVHVDKGGLLPRPRLEAGSVRGRARQSGRMLVQPRIAAEGGTRLDEIIGPGWAVIGAGVDPRAGMHRDDCALMEKLGATFTRVEEPEILEQVGEGRLAVVRPDRFIAEVLPVDPSGPRLRWLASALALLEGPTPMSAFAPDPRFARSQDPVAKAQDLAFVMFARPDLDRMERFLIDFGFKRALRSPDRLVMRGARNPGPAHVSFKSKKAAFVGLALRVRDRGDLEALARTSGASSVEPLDLPGGGLHVRLTDPAGFSVWAVAGQVPVAADPVRPPTRANAPDRRERINEGARPPLAPASILRPGHCVLGAVEFARTARWYMDTFGLIPSDVQCLDDGKPALVFMRCDRGDDPADHHTVVVTQNVTDTYSHSAFEVIDFDDVAMGQQYLQSKGWHHAWGVGRHILGSQIFDYWRDPYGDKVEHFSDGDVFTAAVETGYSALDVAGLYQWGPPVPKDFEKPKMTLGLILKVIGNVMRSSELDFSRVRRLLAAVDAPARPWLK